MYIRKNEIKIKPSKFAFPIYMDLDHFEIFCYSYSMFKIDDIERDIWIEPVEIDSRYIVVYYKSNYRRDADYIRCLRYMLIEAYGTEYVFPTEEPILNKRSVNLKDQDNGKEENEN